MFRFLSFAISLSLASFAAVALPTGLTQIRSVEGITQYQLANGLQVLLAPDDSKPTTTVNVTYRVGSRHENYGETGMAHLLEHLLFKGSARYPTVWAEFTKRGLRANGSTSFDRTNYFASFSANPDNLRWYLDWQSDAMVNSFIAKKDLDTEMTVVRNEFEMGENNASRILMQKTLATMFQWHNYGKSPIGERSDIENVDITRLQAFYRKYYQPDNATLIVAGRFDPEQTLAWVAESFGKITKPQRKLSDTYTLEPTQDGERQVSVRRVGGTASIMMGYHVPAGSSTEFAAVEMLASILGDTPGGRLHKQLVETKLAAQAFGFAWDLAEPGVLLLGASLAPGQDMGAAQAAMASSIDALAKEPINEQELSRARTQWLNAWDDGFADPERLGVALSSAIALGDWRLYFAARNDIRKVTLGDVQATANTWLLADNRTVGLYIPTVKPARAPAAQRVNVAALLDKFSGDAKASMAEAFDATPSNIDARTQLLDGPVGIKLALLPKSTRGNTVHAKLNLNFGDLGSLKGHESVARFTAAMIDKGSEELTRQQIADKFDKLQAHASFQGQGQSLAVAVKTRREHLPAVIDLVGQLLRQPSFAPEPLEEARQQSLAGIAQMRKDPRAVIANRLARHGDPYERGDLRHARSFDEMEHDVKAVTPSQLRDFHAQFYSAGNGEFSAVGDFDPQAVQQALDNAFGKWAQPASGPLSYQRIPQPLVRVSPQRFVEQTPDKANANLLAQLELPISDKHPDHAALSLANYIFGLGGNSRLWKRIRETEGLSYDVRSVLQWSTFEENTHLQISAIFAPQNQAKVEAALNEELSRSLNKGFTQAELDEGRSGLLNFRRLSRAQDGVVTSEWVRNLHVGRRFDFSQNVDDKMASLSLDELNAVWRKYIQPDQLVVAWGGDFNKQ